MGAKLLHFLKIFGITFGIFVAFIAGYLGIYYLITGFKPEVIELSGLSFSQNEYFFSDKDANGDDVESVTIMVMSNPEDTTQKQVELSFVNGKGYNVVELPIAEGEEKCIVNVNEPISLKLKRNETTNEVYGGEVNIKATGVENEFVYGECNIYIDTPISSFDLKVTRGEGNQIATIDQTSKIYPGFVLDFSVVNESIVPENSRQPFNAIYERQVALGYKEENLIRNDLKRVFWESSDESKAKVDENGKVTISTEASVGEVTITARIYKTYELQDNHKTFYDFEYDVNIGIDEDLDAIYEEYLTKITATQSYTITISDISVDNITTDVITSISDYHLDIGVNTTKRFYLDGDFENALGIKVNPANDVPTENFTSENLRYKLSNMFVIAGTYDSSVNSILYPNNSCLTVSSIAGNLQTGFYFTVAATYPQDLQNKGTCLIFGLGVRDEETNELQKNPDGSYVLAKNLDGEDINTITMYIEITTVDVELVAISHKNDYKTIEEIPAHQEVTVDIGASLDLYSYMRYTDESGNKQTLVGQAGSFNSPCTYDLAVFFVVEGTELVDYDETYSINLGQKWYPIGTAPIDHKNNIEVLSQNAKLQNFKGTGELTVICVILKTDINGNVLLVDETGARPVDENGFIVDPSQYAEKLAGGEYFYDWGDIKSGTQDSSGQGKVNNFTVTVVKDFDTSKLTVSQKYGELEYEELSVANDNLKQVYINDGSADDYVYLWLHYAEDEELAEGTQGVLASSYLAGNLKLESSDVFTIYSQGTTNDGINISEDDSGTDILFIMLKNGTTTTPITVKIVMNNETTIFSYMVSITNKMIDKIYLDSNAVVETDDDIYQEISVLVDPSNQLNSSSWAVKTQNEQTGTTNYLPLTIKTKFTYEGAPEEYNIIDDNYDIAVQYSISLNIDGDYYTTVKSNGKTIASITNNDRYFLTSNSISTDDNYGIIDFYTSGTIYLKATIEPYGYEMRSEKIYKINIVVDEENWVFNKKLTTGSETLTLDMPLIDNSGLTGEAKYSKIDLSKNSYPTGVYAQLYKDENNNEISTLLVELSKFTSVSYNGNKLSVSGGVSEFTSFLTYKVTSYNIFSPQSNTYDTVKDSSYNKAEVVFDETTERYYLRIKAVNYSTRINIQISTYFGISDTYTILVNGPLSSEITSGYSEINQEYVATGISFDLFTKLNIIAKTYIYANSVSNNVDLTTESFKTYIKNNLTNVGAGNETNNTDTTEYIKTTEGSTVISVVKDTNTMLSFKLNMAFDFDKSVENGSLTSQEVEWTTYYYVQLIPSSRFDKNYSVNSYQDDQTNKIYKNVFIGQTYEFGKLNYFAWNCLEYNGTESVLLENNAPKYTNRTDTLNLKFKTTSFSVSADGRTLYDSGKVICTIEQNESGYFNVLKVNPNIFDGTVTPNAILVILEIDSNDRVSDEYNIRINPLTINITNSQIETYVNTTYDLTDSVVIKSSTNNDNLAGLNIVYEVTDLTEDITNVPQITVDEDGILSIIPQTLSDGTILYPSNFEFTIKVKVGTLEETMNFICGKIMSSYDSAYIYTGEDYVGGTGKEIRHVSMLEGSAIDVKNIVQLKSSIGEDGQSEKIIYFTSYSIVSGEYVLENASGKILESLNLTLVVDSNEAKTYVYYDNQSLIVLNNLTGEIETTTYLPADFKLYLYINCVYNTSYSFKLPLRVNSVVFTSTLESSTDINVVQDTEGNTVVYLVSMASSTDTSLSQISGDYITASSKNFSDSGDISLDLSFRTSLLDKVTTQELNGVYKIYGTTSSGNNIEICEVTTKGAVSITAKLVDRYEFTLEVMYVFENETSVHSITSYKIVILPEYALEQRDTGLDYSQENPYEVELSEYTNLPLLNTDDSILELKRVLYNGNKISIDSSKQPVYQTIEASSVSTTILQLNFEREVVEASEANASVVESECVLSSAGSLSLPYSINDDVVIKVIASMTINSSQTATREYYFRLISGVKLDMKLSSDYSRYVSGTRYYNITATKVNESDTSVLELDFDEVFTLVGDTDNISGYTIQISSAKLANYAEDTLLSDGIKLASNKISILNSSGSTVSTLEYLNTNGYKRLSTNYAMQKEVYMSILITATYRSTGKVQFVINLRYMPKIKITSVASSTGTKIIAGEVFNFNNNLSITELNTVNYTYGALSTNSQNFTKIIKFKVEGVSSNYSYGESYATSANEGEILTKDIDIILLNNTTEITIFEYTLTIYPLYKYVLEETNEAGRIQLLEGETSILPNKYVFIHSVMKNEEGKYLYQSDGQPIYVLDEEQTDRITLEIINTTYANYLKVIEDVKLYVKVYTSSVVYAQAKLEVAGDYLSYTLPIVIMDVNVELKEFNGSSITAVNPIVLPAGTNEQILMPESLTDDLTDHFYDLYYGSGSSLTYLYYNTASELHRISVTKVSSTTSSYQLKSGTDTVIEHKEDSNIVISFTNNKLTVSGKLTEEVTVTANIYIGDNPDSSVLYFRFLPVSMVETVKESYIDSNGYNYQILHIDSGASVSISDYLMVSSKYTVNGKEYDPNYDFTSSVKFVFPENSAEYPEISAMSGAFTYVISGTGTTITVTDLNKLTSKIHIEEIRGSIYLTLQDKFWETQINEFTVTVEASIGLLKTFLRFYVSPVAFKYNYAYKASDGASYYYHSTYVDYAYDVTNPYEASNKIDLTSLVIGEASSTKFSLTSGRMTNNNLLVFNSTSPTKFEDVQMGSITNVIGYLYYEVDEKQQDGSTITVPYYCAYLKYENSKYYLVFNVKTRQQDTQDEINKIVPVIDQTLDMYLTMTYDDIERQIHVEILPYVQIKTAYTDYYERVDNKGTPEDKSDDTITNYEYFMSGNSSVLDYFYNYQFLSVYDDSTLLVRDIKNTVLERTSLADSSISYEITSYEKYILTSDFVEQLQETAVSLPNTNELKFVNKTLTADADMNYVVYLAIVGRAGNDYGSIFYIKVIPTILFSSIEDTGNYTNKTTSGDKFVFVKVADEDENFFINGIDTDATISKIRDVYDTVIIDEETGETTEVFSHTEAIATYSITVSGQIRTYETVLDIYHDDMEEGQEITICYSPSDPNKIKLSGYSTSNAEVTKVEQIYVNVYDSEGNQMFDEDENPIQKLDHIEVYISYIIRTGTTGTTYTNKLTFESTELLVGNTILIKYCKEIPTIIKYAGYLEQASTFDDSQAVETVLTGSEYDLKNILTAVTPSYGNGSIDEKYDENTDTYYTNYVSLDLEYKVLYAWYYSALNDENGKPIEIMADISPQGNVYIDGEEVVTISNNLLLGSSDLTFDIYLNIQGKYVYSADRIYEYTFYLRVVPAMKFFLVDTSNSQEYEVGKGLSTLAVETVSDNFIETSDDGTRRINLSKYIKGRKIVAEGSKIEINGNIVAYSTSVGLEYVINSVKIYNILSENAQTATGSTSSIILLQQNGLNFENGQFVLDKTFNATTDIQMTVQANIDDVIFSFELLLQLYRDSIIEVGYNNGYVLDSSITYETIVSGTSQNEINFNNGYLLPYVWSSDESKYVTASITKTVQITDHTICKSVSPTGLDKTTIQENIVTFNDTVGTITAKDDILGDYYFTIQLSLYYNSAYHNYTFYFRVLGKYTFSTATLKEVYTTTEGITYNKITETETGEANTVEIMTKTAENSSGMILIGTRSVNSSGEISVSYNTNYLDGLTSTKIEVESVLNTLDNLEAKTQAEWGQYMSFSATNPSSDSNGEISLQFINDYYTNKQVTKKPLYIKINFTFSYETSVFADLYSIQYEIMLYPYEV